jgi:hypothetical protein
LILTISRIVSISDRHPEQKGYMKQRKINMKTTRVSMAHRSGIRGNLGSSESESICVKSEFIHPGDDVPSMMGEQRQPIDFGSPLPERNITPMSSAQSVSQELLQKVQHTVSSLMEKCENNALSENLLGLLEDLDPAVMFEVKIPVKFGN